MARPARRRTQEERREGTIRKLLDAATGALIDVGYGGATVQVICDRAEVSQGGLFRHFATREELMVAVGEDVGRRILEQYRGKFESRRKSARPVELALELVREATRSRLNQAWYELANAARTNPRLKKALAPVAMQYHADIEAAARLLLPELAAALGDRFSILVDTIVAVFDGESVHRFVIERPKLEARRLELLLAFLEALTA